MEEPQSKFSDDRQTADDNFSRYVYARESGHSDYVEVVKRNEDYYFGGGKQWSDQDKKAMHGRPIVELDHITPAVNTALGLQINSRVDVTVRPVGDGADEDTADALSKLMHHLQGATQYHYHETQVFEDGLIQRRGFFEVRMEYADNVFGDISITTLDPLDVLPSPDATGYDPGTWADVIVIRWMTLDDIRQRYGAKKAKLIESDATADTIEQDYDYSERNKVGDNTSVSMHKKDWVIARDRKTGTDGKYLVIDRQWSKIKREPCVVWIDGSRKRESLMTPEQVAQALDGGEAVRMTLDAKVIHWTVTCGHTVLHDDESPYQSYTVIPFFYVFRRGKSFCMVDLIRSPQDLENKAISSYLEILNSTANSGWLIEEESLVNMSPDDLGRNGSKTGLPIVYRKNSSPPAKIVPNAPPIGTERLIDRAELAIKTISGMSDAIQGQPGAEVSGIAIRAKQTQGGILEARAMDNLAYTRRMLWQKAIELIQQFYTSERVFRFFGSGANGANKAVTINQVEPDGSIINDVTIGRYDVVITDTSTHATYQDAQFEQAMMLVRDAGVPISKERLVELSAIGNKHEIAGEVAKQINAGQQNQAEEAKAQADLAWAEQRKADARKKDAETALLADKSVNAKVEAMFAALQAAGVIAATPAVSPLADTLLGSAGYADMNAPPLVPELATGGGGVQPTMLQSQPLEPEQAQIQAMKDPNTGQRQGIITPDFD